MANPKLAFQAEILIVKLMQNKKENSRQKLCEIQQLDESMAKSKTTYCHSGDEASGEIPRSGDDSMFKRLTYNKSEWQSIFRQKLILCCFSEQL